MTVQITLVKLLGYREWTESLGPDREHKIQTVQGRLHSLLCETFAQYGAIAHPLRYDIMIAVTNGVDLEAHLEILRRIQACAPVPVVMSIAIGSTVLDAERRASQLLLVHNNGPVVTHDEIPDRSPVCVVHADLRNSTDLFLKLSAYETYTYVSRIFRAFRLVMRKMSGIALYLGGDNMIGITTPDTLQLDLLRRFSKKYNVRIGIGIDSTPREALRKATHALDTLRRCDILDVMVL